MRDRKRRARYVAVTAVLAALSLVILYLSALSPAARLGVVAIAGLAPAGAVVSVGLGAGFCCYAVTGLLGLLLVPAKGNVLLYLIFFGLYPMVKCLCERTRKIPLEWVCKLIFFNAVLALCWFGLRSIFLPFLPEILDRAWMVWLAGNAAFVVYDVGFTKLIVLYINRVDKMLRKGA